jgi:hypothetical protein
MTDDDFRFSPLLKTARIAPREAEPRWEASSTDRCTWSALLRYHGEWGVEAQTYRDGNFVIGWRFNTKVEAVAWVETKRVDVATGGADSAVGSAGLYSRDPPSDDVRGMNWFSAKTRLVHRGARVPFSRRTLCATTTGRGSPETNPPAGHDRSRRFVQRKPLRQPGPSPSFEPSHQRIVLNQMIGQDVRGLTQRRPGRDDFS